MNYQYSHLSTQHLDFSYVFIRKDIWKYNGCNDDDCVIVDDVDDEDFETFIDPEKTDCLMMPCVLAIDLRERGNRKEGASYILNTSIWCDPY